MKLKKFLVFTCLSFCIFTFSKNIKIEKASAIKLVPLSDAIITQKQMDTFANELADPEIIEKVKKKLPKSYSKEEFIRFYVSLDPKIEKKLKNDFGIYVDNE